MLSQLPHDAQCIIVEHVIRGAWDCATESESTRLRRLDIRGVAAVLFRFDPVVLVLRKHESETQASMQALHWRIHRWCVIREQDGKPRKFLRSIQDQRFFNLSLEPEEYEKESAFDVEQQLFDADFDAAYWYSMLRDDVIKHVKSQWLHVYTQSMMPSSMIMKEPCKLQRMIINEIGEVHRELVEENSLLHFHELPSVQSTLELYRGVQLSRAGQE